MSPEGEWEPDARNWLRWARTAGHDAYWYYRDGFFDEVVPHAGRRAVEIGCGEGRVSRDLAVRGHRVAGVDTSYSLLVYARQEDVDSVVVCADSAHLPFPEGWFDLGVAYNSLQVVADMPGTVREIARVLADGGRFCFCVSHPITDVGRFADDSPGAPFVVRDDYFANRRVDDRVERDGLEMRFRGWTYSLQDYAIALEKASLKIEAMRELRPVGASARYDRWKRIPMFLMVRAVKG
jgi:SAM-dependent methyltransferase